MSKSVLVIDGDRAFATRMSTALQRRGVEARICGDGPEALDEARARRPDLILLCVELPTMSGYAVCNKLKRDEQLRSVPVLLTSAEATADTFEQHRKLRTRADDYLLKPFDAATLLQRVARVIDLPPEPADGEERAFGEEDLKLIDQVFEELASSTAAPGGAPVEPGALAPPTIVSRVEPAAAAPDAAELQRLRARVVELEAELARTARALRDASESARVASGRAAAAEACAATAETRLRYADALRDKTRRALSVVIQALEENPAQRSPSADVAPRRE
jgi:CheY-like chemotaxis protein